MTFSVHDLMCLAPGYAQQKAELPDGAFPTRDFESPRYVGVVQLVGLLRKEELVGARASINALADNDSIGEIIVFVDSPGGTVAGTHDLYLAIAKAATKKKVMAYIEDLGASGAYYAISGASEIVMNPTGVAGSIGVFQVVVDASRKLAKEGVDILVLRSGKFKGTGHFGAKITSDQIDQIQMGVDEQAKIFVASIAKGRKMTVSKVSDLADGRLFLGDAAVSAGLVDRIASVEEILNDSLSRHEDLQFVHLTGHAAKVKFNELVAERVASGDTESWARHLISQIHPGLAQTVVGQRIEMN